MRYILLLFTFCMIVSAADEGEINALIDAIVHSPPETRYEKMNAFKQKMRELNAQQRAEALDALRKRAYPDLGASGGVRTQAGPGATQNAAGEQQMRMQQQMQRQQMQPGNAPGGGMPQPGQPQKGR